MQVQLGPGSAQARQLGLGMVIRGDARLVMLRQSVLVGVRLVGVWWRCGSLVTVWPCVVRQGVVG